jgi:hypothetical protein
MAKRQKLVINSEELVQNLKQSAGKGVDAFFSSPSPTSQQAPEAPKAALESVVPTQEVSQGLKHRNRAREGISPSTGQSIDEPAGQLVGPHIVQGAEEKKESKQASNIAINLASNIAILQNEIDSLLSVAYKAQTFRFTPEELRLLRDISYSLSGLFDKKIGQADILRLGLLLVRKLLETNQEEVIAILQAIKK